jgi:hypothetical protein
LSDAGKDKVAEIAASLILQCQEANPRIGDWGLDCFITTTCTRGLDNYGTFILGGNQATDGETIGGLLDWVEQVDFTQSTDANRPICRYKRNVGYPMAEFDGSNDYLEGSSGELPLDYNTEFWIWFFAKFNSSGTQAILSKHTGSVGYEVRYDGINLTLEMTNTATTNQLIANWPTDLHSDYHLIEIYSNGDGNFAGLTARRDRTDLSGSASVNNLTGAITNASNVTLGARSGGGSNNFDGDFGCLAVGTSSVPKWAPWAISCMLAKQWGVFSTASSGSSIFRGILTGGRQ